MNLAGQFEIKYGELKYFRDRDQGLLGIIIYMNKEKNIKFD